jgi:hypothetical protein
MKQPIKNWTNDEFLAYTLLYAAHVDYYFDNEEKKLILSKVNKNVYKNILKELKKDNDYQSLQKILAYTDKNKFTNNEVDLLLYEIELLFMCDGEYDILEKNMMMNLAHLLKRQNDTSFQLN